MDNQNPTQPSPVNPTPSVGTPPVVEIVPPQTDPQQTPPSGKFSLSPKIMLIILAILIVAVVGSGIYLSAGSQPKPTPTPTPTPLPTEASAKAGDPTASWKTYENQSLALSLKLPQDWDHKDLAPGWDEPEITNKTVFFNNKFPSDRITLSRFLWRFSLDSFVQTSINGVLRIPEKGEPLLVGGQEARQFNKPLLSKDVDVSPGFQVLTTLVKRGEDIFVFETILKSDETKNIYNEILKTVVFGQKKNDAKQSVVKLTNTYTNPTFGYSIKIPDGWKEVQSSDDQKNFRFYIEEQSSGSSDQIGFFKAEIQILTLAFNNPAVKGNLEDSNKLKVLKTGEEVIIGGQIFKKIKDLKIDGRDTIFVLAKSDDFMLVASMDGQKRFVSIILKGYDQETLDKHQAEFEAAVNTFKFNNFSLD